MRKQLLGFILCFLLVGSSVFAADGDLIVNGNVGIGASSPKGSLDITGTTPRIYIDKSNASANRGIWSFNADTDGVLSLQSMNDAQSSAYNAFTITRDGTNGIASVVFPSGNLSATGPMGIGTNAPDGNFQVVDSYPQIGIFSNATAANAGKWRILGHTDLGIYFQALNDAYSAASTFMVAYRDSGTYTINHVVFPNGYLSIGTNPDPSYTLTINGTGYSRYGTWQYSDMTVKENIAGIESPLNKIVNLEGISFNWKKEEGIEEASKRAPEGRQFGVIAQDIEKVLPEVVRTNANGEKAVNYSQIIPVLIEAVKAQQAQIESLKAEVAGLKANR